MRADCCETASSELTSALADRRSVDAEAEPCGIGLVAHSSESSGRVAAEEEWHGMGRVAQSVEEAASEGLVESVAGKKSPTQPCIDA